MPRVNLGKSVQPSAPPIDWLKAAILERMDAKNMNKRDLSDAAGIGYDNMLVLLRKPPEEWKRSQRESVCRVLGIETVLTVVGAPQIGGGHG